VGAHPRARARENRHLSEDVVVRHGAPVDRQLQLRRGPDQRRISETRHFG
jgi:hypothetical protein